MAQAQSQRAPGAQDARESAEISFKRFILDKSSEYESEPMADLFRVNLLGQMMNRYDELLLHNLSESAAIQRTKQEFEDISQQMYEMGFVTVQQRQADSRWPQLTEDEAARYIKESSERQHRQSLGIAFCSACVFPLMVGCALGGLWGWQGQEIGSILGLVGMFGMIGIGVYSIVSAPKPGNNQKIKKGRFSLSANLRRKLRELQTAVCEKARRRKAKGIALLATCVMPILLGAAVDNMILWQYSDTGALLGVAGMFAMIGLGVYEVVMSEKEKKSVSELLHEKEA